MPSAGLDAGDRDPHRLPCRDERGRVQRPVLQAAQYLLALEQQDRLVAVVCHRQFGDRRAFAQLLDEEKPGGLGIRSGQVIGCSRRVRQHGEQCERSANSGLTEGHIDLHDPMVTMRWDNDPGVTPM